MPLPTSASSHATHIKEAMIRASLYTFTCTVAQRVRGARRAPSERSATSGAGVRDLRGVHGRPTCCVVTIHLAALLLFVGVGRVALGQPHDGVHMESRSLVDGFMASCAPDTSMDRRIVERWRGLEASLPRHRWGVRSEMDPDLPRADEPAHPAAWISWVQVRAHFGLVDPLRVGDRGDGTDCDPSWAAAMAVAGSVTPRMWRDLMPLLALVYATSPPPESWVVRTAIHRYLWTDSDALSHLLVWEASVDRPDDLARVWLQLLELGARQEPGLMEDLIDPWTQASTELAATGSPARHLRALVGDAAFEWIHGEAQRLSGSYANGLSAYERALVADPIFPAALLGRASSLVHLGRADDALVDLEFLRLAYGDVAPYAHWIHALERRLR